MQGSHLEGSQETRLLHKEKANKLLIALKERERKLEEDVKAGRLQRVVESRINGHRVSYIKVQPNQETTTQNTNN